MLQQIRNIAHEFYNDDSGAITIDWVVITAACVAMAVAAASMLGDPSKPSGIYVWITYSQFMLGEYVPNRLGYSCGSVASYIGDGCE